MLVHVVYVVSSERGCRSKSDKQYMMISLALALPRWEVCHAGEHRCDDLADHDRNKYNNQVQHIYGMNYNSYGSVLRMMPFYVRRNSVTVHSTRRLYRCILDVFQ